MGDSSEYFRHRAEQERAAADHAADPTVSHVHRDFDAVYNPPETKLLQQAKSAGARTVSGVEMFVRQAARQFELWTGKPAPTQIMRDVALKRLCG